MSMSVHTLATVAVSRVRRGDILVEDLTPTSARITVTNKDSERALTVYGTADGFPLLVDGCRQVTLPDAEAVQAAAAWVDGAELPAELDEDADASAETEGERLFDTIFRAAADATAPGAADDDWPVESGNGQQSILGGPWGATLTFIARTDETGRLTGVSWSGRSANGAGIHGFGKIAGAVTAARRWAEGLDALPALTPVGLRARRQALGLSQTELAELLGVSQPAYAQWESGTRAPRDPAQVAATLADIEDGLTTRTQKIAHAAQADADAEGTKTVTLIAYATRSGGPDEALSRTATGLAHRQLRHDGYKPIITHTR